MLGSRRLPTSIDVVAAACPRYSKSALFPGQVVVSSLQLLQVLVVNQPFVPEVMEETEVRSARLQGLPALEVFVCDMIHPAVPRNLPIVAKVFPVAERASH